MLKYTICFIKKGDEILLLNREKPSWMGMWNGVGGKIEPNETPRESILREITEETGLIIDEVEFKGLVTWNVGDKRKGGMYTYFAELPDQEQVYDTPIKTDEGILDWKALTWILHPENAGVAYYISKIIERIIHDENCHEYYCTYENDQLIDIEIKEVDEAVEFGNFVLG